MIKRNGPAVAASIAVCVAVLTGCSAPAVSDTSAAALQSLVHDVATTAASGDAAAALIRLDAVQAKLEESRASAEVTAERAEEIQQRIDLVRADLQALVPVPAPVAVEPVAPVDTGGDDTGGDDTGRDDTGGDDSDDAVDNDDAVDEPVEEPVEEPVDEPVEAPVEEPGNGNTGNGNTGNGNNGSGNSGNSGNGNGNKKSD
jgi:hypothetical protein